MSAEGSAVTSVASVEYDSFPVWALAVPVPGEMVNTDGVPAVAFEVHRVGGVDCVLAYSSLEALVACCGEHQPWAEVEFAALVADVAGQHLAGPLLNVPLAEQARWTADGPPADASLQPRA